MWSGELFSSISMKDKSQMFGAKSEGLILIGPPSVSHVLFLRAHTLASVLYML